MYAFGGARVANGSLEILKCQVAGELSMYNHDRADLIEFLPGGGRRDGNAK